MNRCVALLFVSLFAADLLVAQEANDELINMVLEFVADDDKDIRGVAYEQIRDEVKGTTATERFAAELPKLSPAAQVGLLAALADRGDSAAKPEIEMLFTSAESATAVAAIRALGKLGDASDTTRFVPLLSSSDKAKAAAARVGLTQLLGDGVSSAIVAAMHKSPVALQVDLIRILASRRALDTIPELLKLANGNDATLRGAAMNALGEIADSEHVAGMVQGVLTAKKGNERNSAEKCLMFVCKRIENQDERAIPLWRRWRNSV